MCIEKNPSPTSGKNKDKLEYISERQPSPLELAFGIEVGLNSHYKNVKWYQSISKINPKGSPTFVIHAPSPRNVECEEVYWEKLKSHIG